MMVSVHSFVRGKIPVHLLEGWWFRCIHVWVVRYRCIFLRDADFGAFMCLEFRCIYLRSDDLRCIHVWGVGYRCIYLRDEWCRCIHVWGVRFRCNYLKDDEFGTFMCEEQDSKAFTWGVTISVHSCVRGKIPVHLLHAWWFRCIHVSGVRFRCIYLRIDDFGAFMCEG